MNNFDYISMSLKKNSSKIISSLLLSAIVTNFYSCFPITRAMAQENWESINQNRVREEESESTSPPRGRDKSSILLAIWKLLRAKREREPALSSRGYICEIAPGLLGKINVIYSDRPLFLWQGKLPSLEIYLYTPFSLEKEQEILWTQSVGREYQKVLYTGESLQPSQIYDWEIVVAPYSHRRRISFQVMSAQKREGISRELEQLETELTSSGATAEEIALERANYFAQRDLWSDALQELFSVENSSTAWSRDAQEIVKYICES